MRNPHHTPMCIRPRPSVPARRLPSLLSQNLELDKLTSLAEQRDRAREAVARMLEDHETWSRAAAERHLAKMEMIEGNRMEQLAALQERLREHVSPDRR